MAEEESGISFTPGEVPSALECLAERVDALKHVVHLFKGWDTDLDDLKSNTILSLSNSKKNLKEILSLSQALQLELSSFEEKIVLAKHLSQRCLYTINNVPERFHCVSHNLAKAEASNVNSQFAVCVQNSASAPSGLAPVTSALNIPEVMFLTIDEFEKVPKYMKGRVTYEKINAFIQLFNQVILQKYNIFKKKKSTLKKKDADLWNEYNKQELKETKGLYFCVEKDFKNFKGLALDKTSLNMLTILRHCGRIREVRTGGILRYVATF